MIEEGYYLLLLILLPTYSPAPSLTLPAAAALILKVIIYAIKRLMTPSIQAFMLH